MHARPGSLRRALVVASVLLFGVGASPALAAPPAPPAAGSGWLRPVDGPLVRPFEAPASVYGAGHRGADLAAPPATPVRAANDGVVSFAGGVAGTLHVTVAHRGGLRTSYSFLATVAVRAGQVVARGDIVGTTGGAGPDHDRGVLHVGLRIGDRYVDPMLLFRPADLTKLVRLVPTDEPAESPWSPARERRELEASLRLPRPGGAAVVAADDGSCGDGVPLVGAVVDATCDVAAWIGSNAGAAIDAGIAFLDSTTGLATATLGRLRDSARATAHALQTLSRVAASALARTPAGQFALDVIEIGRRFARTVNADCTDDARPADGTGGSTHRVMVVAGINSEGAAWDRGPTVDLDVQALGYHAAEGEVRYFSYAADGGPYTADATHGRIPSAAARLREQLRAMQLEQPGREVDLIAHSQGGVVVDVFLNRFFSSADPTLPPLGNVVTLSSPHQGAPLATAGRKVRSTAIGRALLDVAEAASSLPPPSSPAVGQLAEGSPLMDHLWDQGPPDHIDFTTIGATEDLVVPATQISVPGATETVAAVDSVNQHNAIVRAPDALKAVRAALEGRAPPCVGLLTALRSAVAPVVISRVEHTLGDDAAAVIGGGAR